jgi:hypothetical protein
LRRFIVRPFQAQTDRWSAWLSLQTRRHAATHKLNPSPPPPVEIPDFPSERQIREATLYLKYLLLIIRNSKKGAQHHRSMTSPHGNPATGGGRPVAQTQKVTRPGGTTGRVGVRHGVDEAPVPDAESTVEAFPGEEGLCRLTSGKPVSQTTRSIG